MCQNEATHYLLVSVLIAWQKILHYYSRGLAFWNNNEVSFDIQWEQIYQWPYDTEQILDTNWKGGDEITE